MSQRTPARETMKISDVRGQLNVLVNRVHRQETRIVVEKSGIAVAGLVSMDDIKRLERLDRERAERFAIVDEMRAAFADVTAEELEEEGRKAVAAVRAEQRPS